jgi:hypothetical protein
MKKSIVCLMLFASNGILQGANIPMSVLQAISEQEGGTVGKAKKEKNGRYSYGVYQISKDFLTDVNKYYKEKTTIQDVRDNSAIARRTCKKGIEMIILKRKCSLRVALATYNGGWEKRNRTVCKAYASRVIKRAEAIEKAEKKSP